MHIKRYLFLFIFIFCRTLSAEILQGQEVDADIQLAKVTQELSQLKSQLTGYQIQLFEEKSSRSVQSLNSSQKKLKKQYLALKNAQWFWGKVSSLKNDLANNYKRLYPKVSASEWKVVQDEANLLALSLIQNIARLQKEYGIHTFPIVHNLFLEVHLMKRGACKHWAEDLLGIINSIAHPHFTAYWLEAHPGNILEHNVAMLVPKGFDFKEGIIIDPWRTAGKPFWIPVKDDTHPWNPWTGYEPR